ncbi:hypothetical protein QR685DRAFT_514018 [Neurospora intermedia]|uniref:Uncharacterized protein n=1 Tax=Neurospora intermedia TaxID=5142 RepID=A0ABR3DT97_NEUIN
MGSRCVQLVHVPLPEGNWLLCFPVFAFACFTTLAPCSSNLLGMLPIIGYDIEAGKTVKSIGRAIWKTPRYGT